MPQQTIVNRQTGEKFQYYHPNKTISKRQAYTMLATHGRPSAALQTPDGTTIARQSQPNPQAMQQAQQRYAQLEDQLRQQASPALLATVEPVMRDVDALASDPQDRQTMDRLMHDLTRSRDTALGIGTDGLPVGVRPEQVVYALASDPRFMQSLVVRRVIPQATLGRDAIPTVQSLWRQYATMADIDRAIGRFQGGGGQPGSTVQQGLRLWFTSLQAMVQARAAVDGMPEIVPGVMRLAAQVMASGLQLAPTLLPKTPDEVARTGTNPPGQGMQPGQAPVDMSAMRRATV